MGRCAGQWHELWLPVTTGNGTGCSAGGWKLSATGNVTALCLSALQKWKIKIKIPKQRKQREKSSISRVKTNRTFFCSFREKLCILERNSEGRHKRWAQRQDGPNLQTPPRTSFAESSTKPTSAWKTLPRLFAVVKSTHRAVGQCRCASTLQPS